MKCARLCSAKSRRSLRNFRTWDRDELISRIESHHDFPKLSAERQELARESLRTWIPANVEGVLEEAVLNDGELSTDSFTDLQIKFQRTMRIPQDDLIYALPTGLGQLPLRFADDFPKAAPESWLEKRGIITPLARSEAVWIWFTSRYRFAVRIGTEEIDLLSGAPWSRGLQRKPQNYIVVPQTPWDDNYVVRCFVALPLANNCPTGHSDPDVRENTIQIQVTPIRPESFYRAEAGFYLRTIHDFFFRLVFGPMHSEHWAEIKRRTEHLDSSDSQFEESVEPTLRESSWRQVCKDPYEFTEWDQGHTMGCLVHVCEPALWLQITGTDPPCSPLTAAEYQKAGVPWFDDYRGEPRH